ncbi:hypothetical protein [Kribbella sindirgiensis]|uniref:Uncharacterized protein n=1 Tax=Kribbella sindirgiensis TaxID=1124744 RepID=A0A4R0ITX7_9ACTN|nr:hypothetical protein [Kribbella sindirgiensis]TCC32165.1 hypothetical protein E0H50_18225 [Kribbella sindirgiensis]
MAGSSSLRRRRTRLGVAVRLRMLARRRPRQLALAVATSGISAAMLVGAFLVRPDDPGSYWQGLLLNVGSTLLLALITYGLVQAVVVALNESSTIEHPRFDPNVYIRNVRRSSQQVTILETCTELLEPWMSDDFLAAVEESLRRGAYFELFILNPDSTAARRRTDELGPRLDVTTTIYTNLRLIMKWRDECQGAEFLSKFHVYVCHQHPQVQVYRWDDRALISFHIEGELSAEAPQIETHMTSTPWGYFIDKRRAALTADKRTCTLDQYRSKELTLSGPADDPMTIDVHYVTDQGIFYVRGEELAEDPGLAERAFVQMSEWQNEPPTEFSVRQVRGAERRRANELFFRKYGERFEICFRLTPRTSDS